MIDKGSSFITQSQHLRRGKIRKSFACVVFKCDKKRNATREARRLICGLIEQLHFKFQPI